ncbi:MAG: hypothetical protein V4628_02605 [Pseudomonadota bacterium]
MRPPHLHIFLQLIFHLIMLTVIFRTPALSAQSSEENFLDVSIRIFDPPVEDPATPIGEKISSEIRLTEVRYVPMFIRYRLEDSGMFGAVRVLPILDGGAELMLEGQIIKSDGAVLELAIQARDSTGRIWVDKTYSGSAVESVALNESTLTQDAFSYLFAEIVRDLSAAQQLLGPEQLAEIHSAALLKFGNGLLPQFFTDYLNVSADGTVNITRLPAADDPLLRRIEAIREHEYLFIDVVDQEYQQFFTDTKPVYDMWRKFRREQTTSAVNFATRETNSQSDFKRGSYYALQESYNNYRWAKLQTLYLDELSEGFANEVEPTQIELQDSLYKLTGTFEQQYREWRTILAELLALETQ